MAKLNRVSGPTKFLHYHWGCSVVVVSSAVITEKEGRWVVCKCE